MKKILVKSAHLLLIALLCLALGCNLWQLAARALFPQQLPMIGGYAQLTVLSGSMEPAFSAGDLIIIHRETSYQVGDIVSFWDEGSLTTHRLIGQGPEGFITKGDFNNTQDGRPVSPDEIAGRVVLVVPALGQVFLFLRTPLGLLLLFALGLLSLFLPELWGRIRDKGKRCAK